MIIIEYDIHYEYHILKIKTKYIQYKFIQDNSSKVSNLILDY